MTAIFGDTDWRAELDSKADSLVLARRALDMFKRRLGAIDGVRYVFAYEMQETAERPDYHLVFASRHRRGLEKMKEAMKHISKDGSFTFCDATAGTNSLFSFDQPEAWAAFVHDKFLGKTVGAETVWDFVLNETLLVNATGVLRLLEERGFVTIHRNPGAGRKRDLHSMKSITFATGRYTRSQPAAREKDLFDGT